MVNYWLNKNSMMYYVFQISKRQVSYPIPLNSSCEIKRVYIKDVVGGLHEIHKSNWSFVRGPQITLYLGFNPTKKTLVVEYTDGDIA